MVIPSQKFITMHLIYKINFPNGKVYVGQTNNLKKRMTDHLKEARKGSQIKVYRAIRKYSITRDNFEVIEDNLENSNITNEREIYWIAFYDSYKNGYNSTPGGDVSNINLKGENSSKSIFTNEEVRIIRVLRATMKYTKSEIYEQYKDRISESGFHKIWNYDTYTEVAQELNTKELSDFYKHSRLSGSKNKSNIFSREQVIEIRNKYYIDARTTYELADEYKCNASCIQRLVSGKTYSDIEIPEPSFKFRQKKHLYTEEELVNLIMSYKESKLDIKNFMLKINLDDTSVFKEYKYTAFRKLILENMDK